MAAITNTTNFSTEIQDQLYLLLTTGFQSREKGLIRFIPGVAKSKELPKISAGDNPIGAYTSGAPGAETGSATYAERTLTVSKSMIYIEFVPSDWLEIWPMFRSVDNMTNLALNPEVLSAVLQVVGNKAGNQLDRLIWQGDNTLTAPSPLRFIDGFLKYAAADASVIDVANIGAITQANVFDVIEDIYNSIPDVWLEDPSVRIITSNADIRKMKLKNKSLRGGYVGYLDTNEGSTYEGIPIVGVGGMPENSIVTTKAGMDAMSNLCMGAWVDPESEMDSVRIMRVANNSDTWFLRINFKYGVQYVEGSDLVLYQGS